MALFESLLTIRNLLALAVINTTVCEAQVGQASLGTRTYLYTKTFGTPLWTNIPEDVLENHIEESRGFKGSPFLDPQAK